MLKLTGKSYKGTQANILRRMKQTTASRLTSQVFHTLQGKCPAQELPRAISRNLISNLFTANMSQKYSDRNAAQAC